MLANAAAGSADREVVAEATALLATHAPTRLLWSRGPDDLQRLVERHRDDDLVLAGGDGSLHLALGILHRLGLTRRPVGIVALGTGNDFARNTGIPLEVGAAVETITSGRATAVDAMATGDGELVVNAAHVGLGVLAAERAGPLKRVLGPLAYPATTAVVGLLRSGPRLGVAVDGEPVHDGPALAVLVLLGPGVGGGTDLIEGAARGLEVVVVAQPARRVDRLGLALALRRHRAGDDRVRRVRADHVVIECHDGELRANLDGEIVPWGGSGSLTRVPEAWTVWTPRDRPNRHA